MRKPSCSGPAPIVPPRWWCMTEPAALAPFRRPRAEACDRLTAASLRPLLVPEAPACTLPGGQLAGLEWRPVRGCYGAAAVPCWCAARTARRPRGCCGGRLAAAGAAGGAARSRTLPTAGRAGMAAASPAAGSSIRSRPNRSGSPPCWVCRPGPDCAGAGGPACRCCGAWGTCRPHPAPLAPRGSASAAGRPCRSGWTRWRACGSWA